MDRRSFGAALSGIAAAGFAQAQRNERGARRAQYYEFRHYKLTQGDRPQRMNQFASQRLIPLLEKHKFGPAGFFNVVFGEHTPSLIGLLSYGSLAEREELWSKLGRDPDWQKAVTDLEAAPEAPFARADSYLVRAASYAPELLASPKEQQPRYFELRVYRSPTERQLRALNERFGGPEVRIFHRVGIHPILYGETVIGPGMPNLVYLTPFETLAERDKAWQAFGADPEWQKVRKESIERGGQVVQDSSITLLRAAAFSPIR
jgi:hypothetical protein